MLKFSVITVCYNADKFIRRTIESILSQTYSAFELIIIDGASTDHTLEIVKDYSSDKRLFVFSGEDSGIYNAMNRGIVKSTGNYILFLNAGDVFYSKDVLKKVSRYIEIKHPDIVIGNYIEKRHEIDKIVRLSMYLNLEQMLHNGKGVCHQAVLAKKECLEEGFDENYKIAADFDWLCRKLNAGCRIELIDVTISIFDIYGVSCLAKNWIKTREECHSIVEKNFPHMKGKIEQEIAEQYKLAKNQKTQEYLSDFLALKQKNKSIIKFLKDNGINKIAIYGYQYLGQRLLAELENSDIQVCYVIDRDHSFLNIKVPLKYIDDVLDPVDAIIVTPIFEFYDIKKNLENLLETQVISIEDIINTMYIT